MKTKRLLAILLVAMFVIAAIPLSAAATPNPWTYSYKIDVKYALADGTQIGATQQYDTGVLEQKWQPQFPGGGYWYWESKNVTVSGATYLPAGYHLVGKTQEVVKVEKPQHGNSFSKTVTFTVEKITYDYTVYVKYMDGDETVAGPILVKGDTLDFDEITTVTVTPDASVLPVGYELTGNPAPVGVDVAYPQGGGDFTYTVPFSVNRIQTSPSPEIPYIPPQVLIPATPTPEPEIELPEEEIPTDVPDETTEIEEEEELFEDEEIPTDVPATGDASAIIPAIALLALAGAAFALTFKKSRNNG